MQFEGKFWDTYEASSHKKRICEFDLSHKNKDDSETEAVSHLVPSSSSRSQNCDNYLLGPICGTGIDAKRVANLLSRGKDGRERNTFVHILCLFYKIIILSLQNMSFVECGNGKVCSYVTRFRTLCHRVIEKPPGCLCQDITMCDVSLLSL